MSEKLSSGNLIWQNKIELVLYDRNVALSALEVCLKGEKHSKIIFFGT